MCCCGVLPAFGVGTRPIAVKSNSNHLKCFRIDVDVAALVTPWNLPLYLLSWKVPIWLARSTCLYTNLLLVHTHASLQVAPALACGNSIVAKPSEMTPCRPQLAILCIDRIDCHLRHSLDNPHAVPPPSDRGPIGMRKLKQRGGHRDSQHGPAAKPKSWNDSQWCFASAVKIKELFLIAAVDPSTNHVVVALWQADRVLPGGCPCRVWPTPGLLCALRLICTHTNDCLRGRVSSISCMVWAVRRVHRSSRTPRSCHAVIAAVHHACSHTLGQVRVVSFTGGTATGALVAAAAAPSFKKVSLELGGTQKAAIMQSSSSIMCASWHQC